MWLALLLPSVPPALATPSESRMRSEVVPVCRTGSGALFFVSATDHDGTLAGRTTRFWWARLDLGEAAWSFTTAATVHSLDLAALGLGDGVRTDVSRGEPLGPQLDGPALDCAPAAPGAGWVWDRGLIDPHGARVSGLAVHALALDGDARGSVGAHDPGPCRRVVEHIVVLGDRALYVLSTCGPGEVERYLIEAPTEAHGP